LAAASASRTRLRRRELTPNLPLVFPGIDPKQYAVLIQKANAAGFGLAGNSGTASQYGVEVRWDYSPEACELMIECLSTPSFISADTVYAKIKTIVLESV
jgi:hypothetical protein